MTDGAALAAAMRQAGLRQVDLARLAGCDRRQVWRWQTDRSPVPEYAWTIVRQRQQISELERAAGRTPPASLP